jgi:Protein of unknown function C-terminus (DUF2399)
VLSRAAADLGAGSGPLLCTGTAQPTPWDPELAQVMAATGRAVYEESVADALISDLSTTG